MRLQLIDVLVLAVDDAPVESPTLHPNHASATTVSMMKSNITLEREIVMTLTLLPRPSICLSM